MSIAFSCIPTCEYSIFVRPDNGMAATVLEFLALTGNLLTLAIDTGHGEHRERVCTDSKLQALVYDILPSTTAVFSYAIGSRKLSANEQFFCFVCLLALKQ